MTPEQRLKARAILDEDVRTKDICAKILINAHATRKTGRDSIREVRVMLNRVKEAEQSFSERMVKKREEVVIEEARMYAEALAIMRNGGKPLDYFILPSMLTRPPYEWRGNFKRMRVLTHSNS